MASPVDPRSTNADDVASPAPTPEPSPADRDTVGQAADVADEQAASDWDSEQVVRDQGVEPDSVGGGWSGEQFVADQGGPDAKPAEPGGWSGEEWVADEGDAVLPAQTTSGSGQPGENAGDEGRSAWSGSEVGRDAGEDRA